MQMGEIDSIVVKYLKLLSIQYVTLSLRSVDAHCEYKCQIFNDKMIIVWV